MLELDFRGCQIFVLPSTGFELTPLIHCSTIRLALHPAPSTTDVYIYIYVWLKPITVFGVFDGATRLHQYVFTSDHRDITEILLNVALNTIILTLCLVTNNHIWMIIVIYSYLLNYATFFFRMDAKLAQRRTRIAEIRQKREDEMLSKSKMNKDEFDRLQKQLVSLNISV